MLKEKKRTEQSQEKKWIEKKKNQDKTFRQGKARIKISLSKPSTYTYIEQVVCKVTSEFVIAN